MGRSRWPEAYGRRRAQPVTVDQLARDFWAAAVHYADGDTRRTADRLTTYVEDEEQRQGWNA